VSTLAIIIVAFLAVDLILFVGGFIIAGRRREARAGHLREQIEAADHALAQARAGDRGWDLDVLQSAARAAYASRFEGREPEQLHLIQVVDKPGTDADEAVFRAVDGQREEDLVLGREGGQWVAR
jgi:hypothetical protein